MKKLFFLITLTSNIFCMQPDKELSKKVDNIIDSYKYYLSIKENKNPRYQFLTKIVDPEKNLSYYEKLMLEAITEEDFNQINKSIINTIAMLLQIRQMPNPKMEKDLCLLINFLISVQKFDSTLKLDSGLNLLMLATSIKFPTLVSFLLNRKMFNVDEGDNLGVTALIRASICECDGHLAILQMLIDSGTNLNKVDTLKQTALMYACSHGNKKAAEILIHSGANIHLKNNDGYTAYDWAKKNNQTEIMQLFANYGFVNKSFFEYLKNLLKK
ncbi:ankyrin repeat domain-containing protein [Candidatus Dependentiae bacterium]|nr:ankyrin repeat domain-containing protein [Candidatus Dependentiae bacterium]